VSCRDGVVKSAVHAVCDSFHCSLCPPPCTPRCCQSFMGSPRSLCCRCACMHTQDSHGNFYDCCLTLQPAVVSLQHCSCCCSCCQLKRDNSPHDEHGQWCLGHGGPVQSVAFLPSPTVLSCGAHPCPALTARARQKVQHAATAVMLRPICVAAAHLFPCCPRTPW
jgi:hypothetical protein